MSELSKYGYIKEGKVYRYGLFGNPDIEIGVVKESDQDSINYFEERFNQIASKVSKLEEDVKTAHNQGAYLQKLLHLKEQIYTFDALGDFESLNERLKIIEADLQNKIARNKTRNLGLKTGLLQELEAIKESNDWINATEKVKEIKNKWIKIGRVEKDREEEIENRFKELINEFFERKKAFEEEKKAMYIERKNKYEELLNKARKIKEDKQKDPKKSAEELKQLQKEWKEIGYIPKNYLGDLWNNFKQVNNEVFTQLKKAQKRKKKQNSNGESNKIEQLRELTNKAEKLAEQFEYNAVEEVKRLNTEWKKVGFVKLPEAKKLHERFKKSCDKVFELNYLENYVAKKNKDYLNRSHKEQLKIKISSLKELINQEKSKYETFENNFSKINFTEQSKGNNNNNLNKLFYSKFDLHKRRLITKEQLLKEMQEMLNNK